MAKKRKSTLYPKTSVITEGFDPSLSVGSARPAVFRSSTFVFSSPEAAENAFAIALNKKEKEAGEIPELIYSRLSHPNAEILEQHLTPLEPKSKDAVVFNSGMAAISTLLLALNKPGEAFVYTTPLYGGTYHLIKEVLQPLNIQGIEAPAKSLNQVLTTIKNNKTIAMVFVETPSNPNLCLLDLKQIAQACKEHPKQPLLVVDNTLMGPTYQHPIKLGADLVVYSATKYLAGFSDMLGGVILGKSIEHLNALRGYRALLGNIMQADECWILDSRLPTVQLRMEKQSKNAQRIVKAIHQHPAIKQVYYPGYFTDSKQETLWEDQCGQPGALFSLVLKGGKSQAFNFLRHLKIIKNAVSLGGMESLACHPASTTHSEMSEEVLKENDIDQGLVRISVGIEDWRDIQKDIQQALDKSDPI
ncbi:MAG TPA: PLP-dependent aspartate aminotransferase family protein [Oligoflexia bacterium]|nr:PLP-dependent aspartate aminotransferase family protein [Oligoflexia bacterium]HMR25330.1 PLP-dependent aspartate aminotransferase family protein [Oligoflexia bacterium]